MSVQESYRLYRDGAFRVNRQYQRKLVWSLDEKQKLIDSLLHGYPVPLILLATHVDDEGEKSFEILDGMQRLNAVFGFIEHQFGLEGRYFDTDQLSRARQLVNEGVFSVVAGEELLTPAECADFLDYTLAITEFPAANPAAVNEVFARINAYGRQLSPQEKRQAGVVTVFANTVRELAAEIRGDASQSSLELSEMPSVSIDIGGAIRGYGIVADDTIWCKQGILRRSQLRDGDDEQMLADIIVSILSDEPFAFSGKNLDEVYDSDTETAREIERKLMAYGADAMKHGILATVSILRETIETVDDTDNALRRVVHPDAGGNPIKTAFYAIFMAFFELCVKQGQSPISAHRVMNALAGLQNRLQVAAGQIRSEPRRQNIDVVKGLISSHFEEREPPATDQGLGLAMHFENILRRSRVETARFECKQGLLELNGSRNMAAGLLQRIAETVCGIANIGPDSDGVVYIGVADKEADAQRIAQLDSISPLEVGSRFVVGVDRELAVLSETLETYKRRIVDALASSELSEPLKTSVLGKIDCIDYRGLSVICIRVPSQRAISTLADVVYCRQGSSTHRVDGLQRIVAVQELFRSSQ